MQYLTYSEYQQMSGKESEEVFSGYELEAETEINFYTDRRLVTDTVIPPEVKALMFKLIGMISDKQGYANSDTGKIASVSNDGVAISYATQSAQEFMDSYSDSVRKLIVKYLYGVKNEAGQSLIYRGL